MDTIIETIKKASNLSKTIEEYKKKKDEYDEILGEERNSSFYGVEKTSIQFSILYTSYIKYTYKIIDSFSFKKYWKLYNTINYLLKKDVGDDFLELGCNLLEIKSKLEEESPELKEYITLNSNLRNYERDLEQLIDNFNLDLPPCLGINHVLIELNGELKCVCCDHSIKTNNKEELDFYKLVAQKKGILLKEATKEDIPYIKRIVEKIRKEKEKNINQKVEENCIFQDITSKIKFSLREAHLLDSKKYKNVIVKTKISSEEEAKQLLEQIEKNIKEAESLSDEVKTKDLIVEMCKTIKYEILILSGSHIPTLYEEADDDDKIAVAKAFYNLSNNDYKSASGYFNNKDIFVCNTAHPGVNNEILNREIKRPKIIKRKYDNKQ